MQNNARAIPPFGEPRRLQIDARHTDKHIARTHAEYCQHVERPAHETLECPREQPRNQSFPGDQRKQEWQHGDMTPTSQSELLCTFPGNVGIEADIDAQVVELASEIE